MPTEEIIDQSFENIIPQEEEEKEEKKEEKFLKIGKWKIKFKILFLAGAIIFVFVIGLAVLSRTVLKSRFTEKIPVLPSPTPTPFEEKIAPPSAYATDSAILRAESGLKAIEEKIQKTDLKEAGINPPLLDMDVNFKE